MTTIGPALRIRPPLWARAALALFAVAWVVLWLTGLRDQRIGWILAPAGLVITYRTATMGVVGTPDGRLVVRNQLYTRTFRREDLADAVVDRAARGGWPSGWVVWLAERDGSRSRVQVTEAPVRSALGARLDETAEQLRGWIRDTR